MRALETVAFDSARRLTMRCITSWSSWPGRWHSGWKQSRLTTGRLTCFPVERSDSPSGVDGSLTWLALWRRKSVFHSHGRAASQRLALTPRQACGKRLCCRTRSTLNSINPDSYGHCGGSAYPRRDRSIVLSFARSHERPSLSRKKLGLSVPSSFSWSAGRQTDRQSNSAPGISSIVFQARR